MPNRQPRLNCGQQQRQPNWPCVDHDKVLGHVGFAFLTYELKTTTTTTTAGSLRDIDTAQEGKRFIRSECKAEAFNTCGN